LEANNLEKVVDLAIDMNKMARNEARKNQENATLLSPNMLHTCQLDEDMSAEKSTLRRPDILGANSLDNTSNFTPMRISEQKIM
jgi:hypothetical protein